MSNKAFIILFFHYSFFASNSVVVDFMKKYPFFTGACVFCAFFGGVSIISLLKERDKKFNDLDNEVKNKTGKYRQKVEKKVNNSETDDEDIEDIQKEVNEELIELKIKVKGVKNSSCNLI